MVKNGKGTGGSSLPKLLVFAPSSDGSRVSLCNEGTSSFSSASVLLALPSKELLSAEDHHNCYKIAIWDPGPGADFFFPHRRKLPAGSGDRVHIVSEVQCCRLEGSHLHSQPRCYTSSHSKPRKWFYVHTFSSVTSYHTCDLESIWPKDCSGKLIYIKTLMFLLR